MAELFDEDGAYEKAYNEAISNKPNLSVWARAFSEMQGDEKRTVALYIKLRVNQLRENHLFLNASVAEHRSVEKEKNFSEIKEFKIEPDINSKRDLVGLQVNSGETEIISLFNIEKKLREEHGVTCYSRRNNSEWTLKDKNGLIGTFYGEEDFRRAANNIFENGGVDKLNFNVFKDKMNSDEASESIKNNEGLGYFDPRHGLVVCFWVKLFLVNVVVGFLNNIGVFDALGKIAILIGVAFLIYLIMATVCAWQAADIYKGPKIFAYLTKIWIVLSSIFGVLISLGRALS